MTLLTSAHEDQEGSYNLRESGSLRVTMGVSCISCLVKTLFRRGSHVKIVPILLAIIGGCLIVYLVIPFLSHPTPRTFTASIFPKEAFVNGIPMRVLEQSPFTTTRRPRLSVSNPAFNATSQLPYSTDALNNAMTLVTAYFDLGTYWKGDKIHGSNFTRKMYLQWLRVFARIDNPVIAYIENQADVDEFLKIRSNVNSNLTKVIRMDRNKLWSFAIAPHIRQVYSIPGYPKYVPGTVMSEYSCAMHAKYELMYNSVVENHFRTKYFAWTDVGLFRSISTNVNGSSFSLYVPKGFDDNRVAYGVVHNRSTTASVRDIFLLNRVWVCGCIFVASAKTMVTWTLDYLRVVEQYLNLSLMNTDQQVVYAIANAGASNITVQEYHRPKFMEEWFHLGYTCKAAGANRTASVYFR